MASLTPKSKILEGVPDEIRAANLPPHCDTFSRSQYVNYLKRL
jgi:hypothetical protein